MPTNKPKPGREHSFTLYRYPTSVDQAARDRWTGASDPRRIVAGLSSLPLDEEADEDLVRRIELWAVAEGKRLEYEDAQDKPPNFNGMIHRFITAIGEEHTSGILRGSDKERANATK